MTPDSLLQQLALLQEMVRGLIKDIDDTTYRHQYHQDLSPVGWHLGHCVYTECYWLHEVVEGNRAPTTPIEYIYNPFKIEKSMRGAALPPRNQLLHWARQNQNQNLHYLEQLSHAAASHELHKDHYLLQFLIQHYCQHYENIIMVLHQKALMEEHTFSAGNKPLCARPPNRNTRSVQGGHFRVGGQRPLAYDNELPSQPATLDPFDIQVRPVSNAEYLAFMEQGGYQSKALWDDEGFTWMNSTDTKCPESWRQDNNGNWFEVGLRGAYELIPDEPVSGINYFEASAYATWAGGKLPHEYQWETARRLELIENTDRAWEWCENSFHPYKGFEAFPYPEYSQPWFDGKHKTLKGGSMHTQPFIRRPSFRNFYSPEKRHIFSGVRLVF